MRPIKLVVSAFGPYKDKVEIDFEKLGSNGLFLITGDTGSGKTTIFDAISFALFGTTSGSIRENSSLRSDFALEDVRTFVELKFLHKGVIYKVERIPRYKRKKLRGSGETLVSGDATLSYFDEIITGDKNVSEKCIEILGIDANQFKQIVMIAQGEFMELLHSKPSDRAVIFRKIFDTGIYKNISDRLKEKYLSKKREYEDVIVLLDSYKKSIIWDYEIDDNKSIVLLLELLFEYNNKIKLEEDSISLEKKKLDSEYQFVINVVNEGKLINDSISSLNKLKIEFDELNTKKNFYDEQENIINKNKEIYELVIQKRDDVSRLSKKIKEKEKEYQRYLDLKEQANNEYKEKKIKFEGLSKLEDKLKSLNNEKLIYENKLSSWKICQDLEIKLKDKKNILKLIELKEKREVLSKFDNVEVLKEKQSEQEKNYNNLTLKYRECNASYAKAYEEFLNEQAGVLANNLVDNFPCPVCGSLVHPKKAFVSSSVLSRSDINKLKEEVDNVSKELEETVIVINNLKKDIDIILNELDNYNYDELREEINKVDYDIVYIDIDLTNYKREELEREIISIESLIYERSKDIKDVDNIDSITDSIDKISFSIDGVIKEIKDITKSYNDICIEKEKYNTLIVSLDNELVSLKKEFSLRNEEYILAYKNIGYDTEDEYLSVMIDKDMLESMEKEISTYKIKLVEVCSRIKSLEEFLNGKSIIDISELEKRKMILEDEISKKDVSLKQISNKLFNNVSIYNKIESVYDNLKDIEKEIVVYKDLSDTANGNISGKNKLEFEQYVQAKYFDMVIVSANKRFSHMTDERYLLARKEETIKLSDKLGLELEVIDNYTGKRRDVKTLSGGESFKAALSLSLGMSDVIQEFAGGIVVDAMFIDEGFGSLDDNSLESAMNAIMMLGSSDKIIGIISHVNELKNRIDKKIVVKKSNSGSSIDFIL